MDEGRIWGDWEVNRIGVHDVILPKSQKEVFLKKSSCNFMNITISMLYLRL